MIIYEREKPEVEKQWVLSICTLSGQGKEEYQSRREDNDKDCALYSRDICLKT